MDAQKGFLSQVIGQCEVIARKLPEQTANGRLVLTNQLGKGVVIVIDKDAGDEGSIGDRHVVYLLCAVQIGRTRGSLSRASILSGRLDRFEIILAELAAGSCPSGHPEPRPENNRHRSETE